MNKAYCQNIDENNYVDTITDKLANVEDEELRNLILKLVNERNNLIEVLRVDPLTGVYNRRILKHIRNFSFVVICDIDDFKNINDSFGHPVGDRILKLIAKTLVRNSRVSDYVCRYGGDEFLIIFSGGNVEIIKKRMLDVANSLIESSTLGKHKISLSIGISSHKEGATLDDAIHEADKALYISKQSGKNSITDFDELKTNKTSYSLN